MYIAFSSAPLWIDIYIWMFACVHMYIHIYICTCAHTHKEWIYIHACIGIRIYIYIHIYIYIYVYEPTFICKYTCCDIYMYTWWYRCVYIYMCVYLRIYIYIHLYLYLCIYIRIEILVNMYVNFIIAKYTRQRQEESWMRRCVVHGGGKIILTWRSNHFCRSLSANLPGTFADQWNHICKRRHSIRLSPCHKLAASFTDWTVLS